ncbi:MAG: dihydrodipicolinate reductase [Candidatus Bathyarchaeota archaeon BA1]|nr:MAG: dihydrodipicolinate reductase [Candidatus Bathyarchaeota archaeon BA1]
MVNKVRVILFGIGAIGSRIAKFALEKKGLEIVGAIDIASDKVGRDLGEVLEAGKQLGVTITDDADALFSRVKADIVIHATTSHLRDVYPQIAKCVRAGMKVISTCEELSYPYYKHPELSNEIDELAKRHGVTVLGTGINPGYLMDTLPIVLTGPCQDVTAIKVTRMMDSSKRRIPFQKKIGTGLTQEEFKGMIEEKKITGHVGLIESIAMMADALGWELDDIQELPPEPVVAEEEIETPYTTVKPGQVAGLKSVAHGIKEGKAVITLEFTAHTGVKEEYDAVSIEGVANIYEKIKGGVHGDIGTVAMIINMIPKVMNAAPGLVTMKDLPLPSATPEDMRVYLRRTKPT